MNFAVLTLDENDIIPLYGKTKEDTLNIAYTCKYLDFDDSDNELLQYVSKILNTHGFNTIEENFNSTNCIIELHFGFADNNTLKSELCIHQESEGDFLDANTLICYLDNTAEGGELGIYKNETELYCKIPTKKIDNHFICVMFDSSTWHCPQPIVNGYRKAISFHIRSKFMN